MGGCDGSSPVTANLNGYPTSLLDPVSYTHLDVYKRQHLLRIGQFSALDIEHLAEEIEDVGRSEQRELTHRMAILLAHLLKWQYQPERRSTSWALMIDGQRERIRRRLQKTPSLKSALNDVDWWACLLYTSRCV